MLAGGPIIVGLDLGRLTGVAEGTATTDAPSSLTWQLSDPQDGLAVQCAELLRRLGASEASIRSAHAFYGLIAGISGVFGVRFHVADVGAVTKHFTGKAHHGGRDARKRAVIARCRALGYVPRDSFDEDRADACAVWDWACAHLARRPRELVLFNNQQQGDSVYVR